MSKTPVSQEEREDVYTMIQLVADMMDVAAECYRDRLPEVYFADIDSPTYDSDSNEILLSGPGDSPYDATVQFVAQFTDGMPETTDLVEAMGDIVMGEEVDPSKLRDMAKRAQRELKEDGRALRGYVRSMERMAKRAECDADVISEVIDLATRGEKSRALRYLERHRKRFDDVTYSTLRESIEDGTLGSD